MAQGGSGSTAYEGVVEALRQTVVAAQVSGAVIALQVRAGDAVHAGQVLLRIDARAADQTAVAGAAQARAARRRWTRPSTQGRAATATVRAGLHQPGGVRPGAMRTSRLRRRKRRRVWRTPGRPERSLTSTSSRHRMAAWWQRGRGAGRHGHARTAAPDPVRPGSAARHRGDPADASWPNGAGATRAQAEIPGAAARRVRPVHVQLLPAVDVASHTLELRLDLPRQHDGAPGMFARAWLPGSAALARRGRLFVPVAGAGAPLRVRGRLCDRQATASRCCARCGRAAATAPGRDPERRRGRRTRCARSAGGGAACAEAW